MPDISTQPQTTPEGKSINWKRILTVAVIGTVIIGLGVLLFLLLQPKEEAITPTTTKKATPSAKVSTPSAKKDVTANWKVYTNDNIGFTLKYPRSWEYVKENNEEYQDDVTLAPNNPPLPGCLLSVDKESADKTAYESFTKKEIGKTTVIDMYGRTEPRLSYIKVD